MDRTDHSRSLKIVTIVKHAKPTEKRNAPPQSASLFTIWELLTTALILMRLLVPAEGVDQGTTLWIASLWWGVTALWGWSYVRSNVPLPFSLGKIDIPILMLIGGYCLSGLIVQFSDGDRRSALNCIWEWTSLIATWFLLKASTRRPAGRTLIWTALMLTITTLAGFGIWQHFIWYPQQSRELITLVRLEEQQQIAPLSTEENQQFRTLRGKYGTEFALLDEGAKQQLLARTRDSQEPIGKFALANSFAAILIIGFFGSLAMTLQHWSKKVSAREFLLPTAVTLTILTCLILTKSRTAITGTAVAFLMAAIFLAVRQSSIRTAILKWGLGISAVGVLIVAALLYSGGLDQQVLSEAPKSLSYRLEYWTSTWKMIQDHAVFGVGPGNFRQHYFQYKLPGASEEILDPHNMLLDAWANGGILAFFGLCLLLFQWGLRLWNSQLESDSQGSPQAMMNPLLIIEAIAFGVPLTQSFLLEGYFDQSLLVLGIFCGLLTVIATKLNLQIVPNSQLVLVCGIAIFIHLLGAGGLAMPAILQLIFLLFLLSTSHAVHEKQLSFKGSVFVSLASALLCGLSIWTGYIPVSAVSKLTEQARYELGVMGQFGAAERTLQLAADSDRLAAGPHFEMAQIAFERWKRAQGDDEKLFQKALNEMQLAIELNSFSPKQQLLVSQWWTERFARSQNHIDSEAAVAAARISLSQYPHYSPILAQLAIALNDTGTPEGQAESQSYARQAIDLDDLNRSRGHTDKLLPERMRSRLEGLANGPASQ
ncbi:O-antigen ligase family protein [Planctomicrobium sp. SH668]|uniref:O-antigen ligase family protein n=1 Tax=Planctomicrobium sp. SH668 TaxID=3448126 RepID=UPI003F5AF3EC